MFGNALHSSALMSPSKSGQSCISVLISSCFSTNRCSLMTSVPLFQATNTPVLVTMLVVLPKFMCWLPPKAHKAMVRFSAFEPRELPKVILQSGFLVVGLLSIHSLRSSYPMSLTRFLEFP